MISGRRWMERQAIILAVLSLAVGAIVGAIVDSYDPLWLGFYGAAVSIFATYLIGYLGGAWDD